MNQAIAIPEGYRADAKGNLVHESNIKPIDLMRDELVIDRVRAAIELQQQMKAFKEKTFSEVLALVAVSVEDYGAKLGGAKGNITLTSFDGRFQLQIAVQDNIRFDERLQAAQALIREYLDEKTADNPELRLLINAAFETDKAGNISTGRVLSLRRHKIDDPRWQRAMDAIADAVQVVGSKRYVRLYQRVGDTEQYEAISLNLATL